MTLYDDLGVDKSASQDAIKKAYRQLAQETHPDKNGGDNSKFLPVKSAYEVLSNPERRKRYDDTGDARDVIDKESETKEFLASLLMSIIDSNNVVTTDIIAVARKHVQDTIASWNKNKKQAQQRIEIRRNALDRLVANDNGFMKRVIENDIKTKEADKSKMDLAIEQLERALVMLESYSYQADLIKGTFVYGGNCMNYGYP